jgi:ribonuclease J
MGGRKLAKVQSDDVSKRQNNNNNRRTKRTGNSVLDKASSNMRDMLRAQKRTSEDVNARASQHVIGVPVNRSKFNGLDGEQYSPAKMRNRKPAHDALKVIMVGGESEMGIGKNCIAIEYKDEIVIIDIGLLFPHEADYPGVNYIVPDMTYLEARRNKIKAIAFTHGHLDHIGAARHLLQKFPGVPVYSAKYTLGLIERQLSEDPANENYPKDFHAINQDSHEIYKISENLSLEFIRVNHSIPDACAIVIRTPLGAIYHSGDWRFESDPMDGKKFDLERVAEIAAKEGFLLMLNEATNVEDQGTHSHSEKDIIHSVDQILEKWTNSRIIFSSFSSQILRLGGAIEAAARHGRKVAIAGFSMINNMELAIKQGLIKVPKNTIVKIEDLAKLPDGQFMLLCTGSQGEMNAVLNRMASGMHPYVKIKGNDVIVFSSNPIPGNEPFVVRTADGLMREGSDVLRNKKTAQYGVGPLHLSGHAYYDDHVKLTNVVHPKYYVPIYGEYHMLVHGAEMAELACGVPKQNIFVCDDGDVLEITDGGAHRVARIQAGGVMYDNAGEIVSEVVLKDRIHMAGEGLFTVVVTVEKGTGRLLSSPDIISRGFIYLRDSEELMNSIRNYTRQKITRAYKSGRVVLDNLKKEMKDEISYILFDQTGRTPIVIPVVNEILTGKRVDRFNDKKIDTGDDRRNPVVDQTEFIKPTTGILSHAARDDREGLRPPRRLNQQQRAAEFARRAAQVGRVYKTNLPKTTVGQPPRANSDQQVSFKKTIGGPAAGNAWRED